MCATPPVSDLIPACLTPNKGDNMQTQHKHQTITLSTPEAADYIGMSEVWLRQGRCMGKEGHPPYVKMGRSIRYLRADLDAWLASRRHAA